MNKGEKMCSDNKILTVFNQRLAGYLMLNGFVLISTKPDKKKTGRNVFYFNQSDEIKETIKNYLSQK